MYALTMTDITSVQTPLPNEFLQVYAWSSQNTAETRQKDKKHKYFWPRQATVLLESLKLTRGQLVALVGVSGVGKSSAQREIAKTLSLELAQEKIVYFKWPGKFETSISLIADSLESAKVINRQDAYLLRLIKNAESDPQFESKLWAESVSLRDLTLESLKSKLDQRRFTKDAFIKRYLKTQEQKEVERDLVLSSLENSHSILIDMRDYGMKDKRAMMNDLSEIQSLWQILVNRNSNLVPNFVFVIQKELAMSEGVVTHFFLGKSRIIEITPFSPDELVDYYKQEFGSVYPFKSEDELEKLARFSRGIFRRFLRYIKLSLEGAIQTRRENPATNEISIDKDTISKTLDSDELEADWQMDLQIIFPNPRLASIAIDLLIALHKTGPTTQSTLIHVIEDKYEKEIGISDASRILSKLEDYGYVRRKREGNGKVVSLNI